MNIPHNSRRTVSGQVRTTNPSTSRHPEIFLPCREKYMCGGAKPSPCFVSFAGVVLSRPGNRLERYGEKTKGVRIWTTPNSHHPSNRASLSAPATYLNT